MHVIVCASVCEFQGQNSFKEGRMYNQEKFNFSKKWKKKVKIAKMVQGSLEIFLDLG